MVANNAVSCVASWPTHGIFGSKRRRGKRRACALRVASTREGPETVVVASSAHRIDGNSAIEIVMAYVWSAGIHRPCRSRLSAAWRLGIAPGKCGWASGHARRAASCRAALASIIRKCGGIIVASQRLVALPAKWRGGILSAGDWLVMSLY